MDIPVRLLALILGTYLTLTDDGRLTSYAGLDMMVASSEILKTCWKQRM
jgi:hypothetical protein